MMTFNIIYTPNTAKCLGFYVNSLLAYTSFRFRLVANGCSISEINVLKDLCATSSRLIYCIFPSLKVVPHGIVLNYLQAITSEEFFCFLDSDIFAVRKIVSLSNFLESYPYTAVFSALPLWIKESERFMGTDFSIMSGNYNETNDNLILGSTFFAIYNNEALGEIMQHYSIGFEQCGINELQDDIKLELRSQGIEQAIFDTGKIINILLDKYLGKLYNIEIPELCHLGGISSEMSLEKLLSEKNYPKPVKFLQKIVKNILPMRYKHRNWYNFNKFYKNTVADEYRISYQQKIIRRNIIREHFTMLYVNLSNDNRAQPVPIIGDVEIDNKVKEAHCAYLELFNKFHK